MKKTRVEMTLSSVAARCDELGLRYEMAERGEMTHLYFFSRSLQTVVYFKSKPFSEKRAKEFIDVVEHYSRSDDEIMKSRSSFMKRRALAFRSAEWFYMPMGILRELQSLSCSNGMGYIIDIGKGIEATRRFVEYARGTSRAQWGFMIDAFEKFPKNFMVVTFASRQAILQFACATRMRKKFKESIDEMKRASDRVWLIQFKCGDILGASKPLFSSLFYSQGFYEDALLYAIPLEVLKKEFEGFAKEMMAINRLVEPKSIKIDEEVQKKKRIIEAMTPKENAGNGIENLSVGMRIEDAGEKLIYSLEAHMTPAMIEWFAERLLEETKKEKKR